MHVWYVYFCIVSDSIVRVFTKDPARVACEEDQKAFEELVASSSIPTQLGDIKMEELPGPEALINPGLYHFLLKR